jgi:hypothetical protein
LFSDGGLQGSEVVQQQSELEKAFFDGRGVVNDADWGFLPCLRLMLAEDVTLGSCLTYRLGE